MYQMHVIPPPSILGGSSQRIFFLLPQFVPNLIFMQAIITKSDIYLLIHVDHIRCENHIIYARSMK